MKEEKERELGNYAERFSLSKKPKNKPTHHPKFRIQTCVEFPKNRPFSIHILVIPDKIHLLPHITKKPIHILLSKVIRPIKPIGSKNPHLKVQNPAFFIGVQCVYIRGAVVPLEIVLDCAQLGLDYVEVSAVGPVVP